jgi:predicted solute-binding protein
MDKSILKIQIITKKYKLLQSMGIKADKKIISLYLVSGQIKALELAS